LFNPERSPVSPVIGCRPITLPQHKGRDYPTDLARAIIKQAGL